MFFFEGGRGGNIFEGEIFLKVFGYVKAAIPSASDFDNSKGERKSMILLVLTITVEKNKLVRGDLGLFNGTLA